MNDKVLKILFLSVCILIWWVALWGLIEEPIHMVTKGRLRLRFTIYIALLVLIFFSLYDYPEIFESF
jgi:hypothetical protein